MRTRALFAAGFAALLLLTTASVASAASFDNPVNPAPSWFTAGFKQKVDAAGHAGVPLDGPTALDVCPGAVFHEGGVGTGTCLVYPYGCTANFVYSSGTGTAPAVANGSLYLGSAGHCSDKPGQSVYAAISTPGVGPSIAKIGTVSKRVEDYPDSGNVHDFESIKIDSGYNVYPDSPVGGPQGIYDGCQVGTPLKYYGHGYEVAVAQGKPGAGVSTHWYDDGYGWAGLINGGDAGSGVLNAATNQAVGDLTATIIVDPNLAFAPGESVGSRITWILSFTGFSLVNADRTLARDTTSPCGTASKSPLATNGAGKGGGKGGKPPKL